MPTDLPPAEPAKAPGKREADNAYFQRRSADELQMAHNATLPEAAAVHRALAGAYLERIALAPDSATTTQATAEGRDDGEETPEAPPGSIVSQGSPTPRLEGS